MAIHIDIYAHLKKSQLIKEGEQLKKYVESLENDANKRLEKGAQGRSQKLIRLNDQQAKSYDQLINASDSYVSSLNREKAAEAALKTLKRTKKKDIKDEEKHALALAAAEREVTSAMKDRAFAAQKLTAAANTQTRAMRDLAEEDTAHTKNARQVGALLTANRTRMANLSAATNKQRREMQGLHSSNQTLVKDNKAVAKGLERTGEAAEKTATETKKLNEMVKEGVSDYKQLRAQSDRVVAAHKAERKVIKEVNGGIQELVKGHQLQRVVVDANQRSLKDYSKAAQQSSKQIKNLQKSNAALIDGNVKLSRSFTQARDATKAANREHQEYKRLIANGASQDVLRKKAERVADAYVKQAREVRAAGKALNESLTQASDRDSFIRSQSNAMRDFSRGIADANRQVDSLKSSHESQIRSSGQLSRAFNTAAGSVRRAATAQKDYDRLVTRGAGRDDLQRAAQKASEAYVQQRRDVDEATNALRRHSKEKRAEGIRGLTGGPGEYASRNIAALTPLGRVNAGVGLPLLGLAGNFAEAAVTASQSIALLPGLATSAAAAIGTLAIGFHGFFDTLGNMGDPKLFAEGLALLAPNAQQAAIQIKALVDGPLGDLKAMVQNNLFANVAPQLGAVVDTLGPQMSKLFGGISTEMNKAFMGITNLLMMPDVQNTLSGIVDGIVVGFQHILPMLSPLTEAFLTLTEVGASFLPQLGDLFTEAATSFRDFVQVSAGDGSLQTFIQKGIDATIVLLKWVKDLGVAIYEQFGNKSPDEFKAALEGALSTIKGILAAIQTLSEVVNDLTPVFTTVFGGLADAVGGASNLAYAFVGIWTGQKLYTAINSVAGLFGKSIGGALTGLVGTAEKSSTGITAALAKVKIPPMLLRLLKGGAIAAAGAAGYEIADATLDSDWMNNAQSQNNGTGPLGLGDNPIVKWINRNTPDFLGGDHYDAEGRWIDKRNIPPGSTDTPTDPLTGESEIPGKDGIRNPDGTFTRFPGAKADPYGWMGGTDPTKTSWTPQALPSNAGKYEFSNIPIGQFQGAQWQVPQGALDLPVDYDNLGKQGFYRPDPLKIMDKQSTVDNKRQTAEEARSKYLDLVAAGNTRQEELNKASNDVVQAEQGWLSSMRDLKEAERGEFEDLTGQMDKFGKDLKDSLGDMGAALDSDLGISKGLAGMADNLVRFVGSLALAPSIAKMKKAQFDAGFPNGEGAGMGLMGYLTAPWAKPTRDTNKDAADAYRAQYGIDNYGLSTVTPNGPVPTDIPQSLAASLSAAGIDPAMFNVIGGFAKTEGNNPSGVPTLGFTDGQAGTSLADHANALARQIGARSSVTGPFPAGGTPQEQASWMATLVGQNGVASDWQGNAQPSRDDYVGRIVSAMGGGGPGLTSPANTNPALNNPGAPRANGYMGDQALLANVPVGRYGQDASRNLLQGLSDCSSSIGDLVAIMDGKDPNTNANLTTGNASSMLPQLGFQRGMGAPGDFRVGYNGGHMQATLPDGTPWNWGSDSAAARRGIGGSGADDPAFNEHWFRPAGGSPGSGMLPGVPGTTGSIPSGSGTPVFVTNWPGGGGFGPGGGAPGAPGGAPMAGAPGGPGGGTPHLTGGTPGPGTPGGPHITGGKPGPGGDPGGLFSPENTNPALNNPPAPGGVPGLAGKGAGGGNFLSAWKDAIAGNNTQGPVDPMLGPLGLSGTATGTAGRPADLPQWKDAGGIANWMSQALTGGPNHKPWDDLSRYGIDISGAGRALGSFIRDSPNVTNANASTPMGEWGGGGGSFGPYNGAGLALSAATGATPGGAPRPGDSIFAGMPNPNTSVDDALRGITTPTGPAPINGYNPGLLTPGTISNYQGVQSSNAASRAAMDQARTGGSPWGGGGGSFAPENSHPPVDFIPGLWDNISKKLPGFASGGEVPIMAHSGEHVLTTKDVAAMGGHQGVLNFRNSLQSFDGGGAVNDMLLGGGGNAKGAGVGETTKKPSSNKFLDAVRESNAGVNKQAPVNPLTAPVNIPPAAAPAVPAAAGPVAAPAPLPAPAAAPTPIGAQHEGNTGIGKGLDVDTSALTGGFAGSVPGMQAGIKLAERGIEYAGQVAAIGVQGLMETFLPTGGSELANNNWLTRIAGAVAGAAPAIANMAGGKSNPEGGPGGGLPPGPAGIPGLGPSTPEQIASQSMAPPAQAAAPAANVTNFNYTANGVKGAEEAFPDAARAWDARPGQR